MSIGRNDILHISPKSIFQSQYIRGLAIDLSIIFEPFCNESESKWGGGI